MGWLEDNGGWDGLGETSESNKTRVDRKTATNQSLFELWIFPTSPDLIERRQHSDHQSGRYSDRVHGLFQHDLVAVGQLQKHQSSLSNKVQYDVMLIGN